jgi:membrane protein YdbS with pleckstrin-like domain
LTRASSEGSVSPVWSGKPWVLPGVIARTVLVLVVAVLVVWLELTLNVASVTVVGLQVVLWTGLLFILAWLFSLLHLVLLRASNQYVLRRDSLEVRTGILATKTSVIVPSGFSDLEVDKTAFGRILDFGDIAIRTQSEGAVLMTRVRRPLNVADQIRKIMARPIVRIEGEESTAWNK